jgi:hypothetical protein
VATKPKARKRTADAAAADLGRALGAKPAAKLRGTAPAAARKVRPGAAAAKAKAKPEAKPEPLWRKRGPSDQGIAQKAVLAYRSQVPLPHRAADGKIVRRPTTGDDLANLLALYAVTGSFAPRAISDLHEAEMMAARLKEITNLWVEGKPGRWTFDEARQYVAELFAYSPGTVHSPKRLKKLREAVAEIRAAMAALQNERGNLK